MNFNKSKVSSFQYVIIAAIFVQGDDLLVKQKTC